MFGKERSKRRLLESPLMRYALSAAFLGITGPSLAPAEQEVPKRRLAPGADIRSTGLFRGHEHAVPAPAEYAGAARPLETSPSKTSNGFWVIFAEFA